MNHQPDTDLKEMAEKLRKLEEKLRERDLPAEKVVELVRESARLAAEAGAELERSLRTSGTGEHTAHS